MFCEGVPSWDVDVYLLEGLASGLSPTIAHLANLLLRVNAS